MPQNRSIKAARADIRNGYRDKPPKHPERGFVCDPRRIRRYYRMENSQRALPHPYWTRMARNG